MMVVHFSNVGGRGLCGLKGVVTVSDWGLVSCKRCLSRRGRAFEKNNCSVQGCDRYGFLPFRGGRFCRDCFEKVKETKEEVEG